MIRRKKAISLAAVLIALTLSVVAPSAASAAPTKAQSDTLNCNKGRIMPPECWLAPFPE